MAEEQASPFFEDPDQEDERVVDPQHLFDILPSHSGPYHSKGICGFSPYRVHVDRRVVIQLVNEQLVSIHP